MSQRRRDSSLSIGLSPSLKQLNNAFFDVLARGRCYEKIEESPVIRGDQSMPVLAVPVEQPPAE